MTYNMSHIRKLPDSIIIIDIGIIRWHVNFAGDRFQDIFWPY